MSKGVILLEIILLRFYVILVCVMSVFLLLILRKPSRVELVCQCVSSDVLRARKMITLWVPHQFGATNALKHLIDQSQQRILQIDQSKNASKHL